MFQSYIIKFHRAAEYLVRTGPIVTLEVAKQGAIYHGLATLLSQPSPVMTRGKCKRLITNATICEANLAMEKGRNDRNLIF